MHNLLLISHGNLAEEFLNTSKLILGNTDNIIFLGLDSEECKEDFEKRLDEACSKIYTSDGVLVLADLYGGTPCNCAILKLLYKYDRIQILTGLNLVMLLQAIISRDQSLEDSTLKLKDDSRDAICIINRDAVKYDEN